MTSNNDELQVRMAGQTKAINRVVTAWSVADRNVVQIMRPL